MTSTALQEAIAKVVGKEYDPDKYVYTILPRAPRASRLRTRGVTTVGKLDWNGEKFTVLRRAKDVEPPRSTTPAAVAHTIATTARRVLGRTPRPAEPVVPPLPDPDPALIPPPAKEAKVVKKVTKKKTSTTTRKVFGRERY